MQKTKQAKKDQDNSAYRELPVFEERRIDSVKRNFAIGIDKVGTSLSLNSGSSRLRKEMDRN